MAITRVVLGADDPEMRAIKVVARAAGVAVEYATVSSGRRVSAGEAYSPAVCLPHPEPDDLWVECMPDPATAPGPEGSSSGWSAYVRRADHHRPGDPGFGHGPADFWEASSLGQVIEALRPQLVAAIRAECEASGELTPAVCHTGPLAGWGVTPDGELSVPAALLFIAAADHCLAAALQGQCPGVDPDALLDWRLTAHGSPHTSEPDGQGGRRIVPPEVVRERAELARWLLTAGASALRPRYAVPESVHATCLAADTQIERGPMDWLPVVDLRPLGSATVGLPIADVACRLGLAYVLRVREGYGTRPGPWPEKVVLGGCGEGSAPGVVSMDAWERWCRSQGYTGKVYGDPVRGYAGCAVVID